MAPMCTKQSGALKRNEFMEVLYCRLTTKNKGYLLKKKHDASKEGVTLTMNDIVNNLISKADPKQKAKKLK